MRRLVLPAVLLATALAGIAHADLPKRRLDFAVAPALTESCPTEETFRKRVALRLGYDPFLPGAAAGEGLAVRIEGAIASPRARVALVDGSGKILGERALTPSASCDELVADAAFAASVALDPAAAMRPAVIDAPAPAPSPAPAPVPASAPAPAPAPAKDSRAALARAVDSPPSRLSLGLGGGAATAILPTATPVFVATAELARGRIGLGLEGRVAAARTSVDGVEVHASLTTAALFGCVDLADLRVVPVACIASTVGFLGGASVGIAEPKSARTPYVAIGPRLGARIPVGWLSIEPRIEVPFVVTSTRLEVDGRPLWSTETTAVVATIAVAARIW
jgi:hypothetical protein